MTTKNIVSSLEKSVPNLTAHYLRRRLNQIIFMFSFLFFAQLNVRTVYVQFTDGLSRFYTRKRL